MIESKAPFWRKILKRLRFKKAEKRRIALRNLEEAVNMKRVNGRIDAIREAYGELASVLNPVDKEKIRRAI
jgi:hypothetical protein